MQNKPEHDILSPEGVEERVKEEFNFRLTMTQGGKYRVYCSKDGSTVTLGVFDSFEEARKATAKTMVLTGHIYLDPETNTKIIMKELRGEK